MTGVKIRKYNALLINLPLSNGRYDIVIVSYQMHKKSQGF